MLTTIAMTGTPATDARVQYAVIVTARVSTEKSSSWRTFRAEECIRRLGKCSVDEADLFQTFSPQEKHDDSNFGLV